MKIDLMRRKNLRRLKRSEAPTLASAPSIPPFSSVPFPSAPSPSPSFTLPFPSAPSRSPSVTLPSAPFPPRSETDVQYCDSRNLLTVTDNDSNKSHSPSVTSLPPYDIAAMDQQLPTYEQAISLGPIQNNK